jgi:hypothetical protein
VLRAALCIVLAIWCGGLLAQGLNVPAEKRETRKSSAPATTPRSERPQRKEADRAGISVPGRAVEETSRPPDATSVEKKSRPPERASISRPEAPPSTSRQQQRPRPDAPPRERASISRTVESSRSAPVERERRNPETPAPVFRQPKPPEERSPVARTLEAAKTAPIEREQRPRVAEVLLCSAQPQCTAVPASCRAVAHSYGGGNRAAARNDAVKSCRLANNFNACCAESCASAVHCRAR